MVLPAAYDVPLCPVDASMTAKTHKIGIATVSLGWHHSHTLERKLDSIAKQGYHGVEIYYQDLVDFARQNSLTQLQAASKVGALCKEKAISIIALQPLFDFAGVSTKLQWRLEKAREYILLARAMGTNMIQVPTTEEPADSSDSTTIYFAFEALSWGIHHALLDDAVRIVKLVDRPNFGLCLDTYHVIARVWADPHASSGGTGVAPGGYAALHSTLERFMEQCPTEKIFYIQLSDAEKLDQPLIPGHPGYKQEWAHWDATMHWCVWGRLFPLEKEFGAYFPMDDILRLWIRDKGWRGWVSMEIFHRHEAMESFGPEILAERGYKSWLRIKSRLMLD